ncbi:MAG: DNA-directed RNA polymerase subunit alpha [Anaerolineae bacterium]|nr:DNA-directed RNA polymerase subunit alpha [Anaerolineae bacterium]MCA9891485.1 DNA-directed RNA polymerase subunit alpha [Anaerolineae bacterium]MCB9461677.1 DNA-directed RNA polymerase subunit alpha [Anaerolineaceae bacterium]
MVLPHKVETNAVTQNYGRFIISPLESGFGLTLGNALRRVLLSSLPGAAVTSVRVSDVHHEFSAIPNVREDMTQLILQVKQLRLILHEGESARLRLDHRGEGTVLASDIWCPPEVQIINPDLYLFTVDSPDAHIEMEFEVRAGRGFSPAEDRGRLPIGELPVDAIFSPIRRANFTVESARVGQRTNYDKLVLEVWTDGSIRPEEAMSQAAQILMRHLVIVSGIDPDSLSDFEPQEPPPAETQRPPLYDKPIEELDLSVRVFNSLKRTGITSVGDVIDMLQRGQDAMLAIRNFGEKSLDELTDKLSEKGYWPIDEGDEE